MKSRCLFSDLIASKNLVFLKLLEHALHLRGTLSYLVLIRRLKCIYILFSKLYIHEHLCNWLLLFSWWLKGKKIGLPGQETLVWLLGHGRSPGEGNGNPFQYSCVRNPMEIGAWWATYNPWGHMELDMTQWLSNSNKFSGQTFFETCEAHSYLKNFTFVLCVWTVFTSVCPISGSLSVFMSLMWHIL